MLRFRVSAIAIGISGLLASASHAVEVTPAHIVNMATMAYEAGRCTVAAMMKGDAAEYQRLNQQYVLRNSALRATLELAPLTSAQWSGIKDQLPMPYADQERYSSDGAIEFAVSREFTAEMLDGFSGQANTKAYASERAAVYFGEQGCAEVGKRQE